MTDQPTGDLPGVSVAVIAHKGRVLLVRRRVAEGELSWQFPAGKIEPGESSEKAAVRETLEETSLRVVAVQALGERVHPKTQRLLSYTACEVVTGVAHVADDEEITEVAWRAHSEIATYVPFGLFPPVQAYLDRVLPR